MVAGVGQAVEEEFVVWWRVLLLWLTGRIKGAYTVRLLECPRITQGPVRTSLSGAESG